MLAHHRLQQGVSLIESMIALLVISVGLLGIAALQINSVKQNSAAYWHSQAVIIGHDMADRIRANAAEPKVNYAGIDTEDGYATDCINNPCTTADMIQGDAAEWEQMLEILPAGRGIIRAPVAGQLDVVVLWDAEGTGAAGTNCGPDPKTDLTCYTITMSSL